MPGAPLACDDGDLCTRDACLDGRCTHAPLAGFDAVLCRLDGIRQILQSIAPTALGGGTAAMLIQHTRDLTAAAEPVTGRRRVRRLGRAGRQLTDFMRLVRRAEHRGEIETPLASRLLTLAGDAVSELRVLSGRIRHNQK